MAFYCHYGHSEGWRITMPMHPQDNYSSPGPLSVPEYHTEALNNMQKPDRRVTSSQTWSSTSWVVNHPTGTQAHKQHLQLPGEESKTGRGQATGDGAHSQKGLTASGLQSQLGGFLSPSQDTHTHTPWLLPQQQLLLSPPPAFQQGESGRGFKHT